MTDAVVSRLRSLFRRVTILVVQVELLLLLVLELQLEVVVEVRLWLGWEMDKCLLELILVLEPAVEPELPHAVPLFLLDVAQQWSLTWILELA